MVNRVPRGLTVQMAWDQISQKWTHINVTGRIQLLSWERTRFPDLRLDVTIASGGDESPLEATLHNVRQTTIYSRSPTAVDPNLPCGEYMLCRICIVQIDRTQKRSPRWRRWCRLYASPPAAWAMYSSRSYRSCRSCRSGVCLPCLEDLYHEL